MCQTWPFQPWKWHFEEFNQIHLFLIVDQSPNKLYKKSYGKIGKK